MCGSVFHRVRLNKKNLMFDLTRLGLLCAPWRWTEAYVSSQLARLSLLLFHFFFLLPQMHFKKVLLLSDCLLAPEVWRGAQLFKQNFMPWSPKKTWHQMIAVKHIKKKMCGFNWFSGGNKELSLLVYFHWFLWNLTLFFFFFGSLLSLQVPTCLSSEPSARWPSKFCSAPRGAAASPSPWLHATSTSPPGRWRLMPASTPCPSQKRTTPRCSLQVRSSCFWGVFYNAC